MKVIKKEAWPEIMQDEIYKARTRKFKYGSHDCCAFANRIVKAMTGVGPAKKLMGYKTKAGAIRTLKRHQGTLLRTMNQVMKDHECEVQKNPKLLKRGDVCMAKVMIGGNLEWAVGICVGPTAVFASDGVVHLKMRDISKGWHLG